MGLLADIEDKAKLILSEIPELRVDIGYRLAKKYLPDLKFQHWYYCLKRLEQRGLVVIYVEQKEGDQWEVHYVRRLPAMMDTNPEHMEV